VTESLIYDHIIIGSVGVITNIHRRTPQMPQVYIRDNVYHDIIETGIKTRVAIRDFVNEAVSDATQQRKKKLEESKDE